MDREDENENEEEMNKTEPLSNLNEVDGLYFQQHELL
jgi:hypothetical protein